MSTTSPENTYFVYDEIDNPVTGSCPVCGGEVFLDEAAQAAQAVENPSDEPLDIPQGHGWCPTCNQAVIAIPEDEE